MPASRRHRQWWGSIPLGSVLCRVLVPQFNKWMWTKCRILEDPTQLFAKTNTRSHKHSHSYTERNGKEKGKAERAGVEPCGCQFNEIVLHSIELPTGKENKSEPRSSSIGNGIRRVARTRQTNMFRPAKDFGVICIAFKHQRPTFDLKLIFSNTKWPKRCQLSHKVADIGDAQLVRR